MVDETILRLPAVMERTGLSRSSVYKLIAEGRFPKQVRLSKRSVGWLQSELNSWVRQQIVDSRNPED